MTETESNELTTQRGLKLEPVLDTEGHWAAYDDLGCQYWVHGGGAYWQAQYAKSKVLHLSVGEYTGASNPESALTFLEAVREGFIRWLFTLEAVHLSDKTGNTQLIKIEDIPPFKAVVINMLHMSDTEAAYGRVLEANQSGKWTAEISVFWDHYLSSITGEVK